MIEIEDRPIYVVDADCKEDGDKVKEKIIEYYVEKYEELDDTLEYEDFLEQLGETYGVYIGDIYDITEF